MRLVPATAAVTCGTLLSVLSGCYGPMYTPYPNGAYPGYPGPIQTQTPGAPYVPQGAAPYGGAPYGGSMASPSTPPTYQNNLSPVPDNGGDAPAYNPGNSGGSSSGAVPYYPDASDPAFKSPIPSRPPGSTSVTPGRDSPFYSEPQSSASGVEPAHLMVAEQSTPRQTIDEAGWETPEMRVTEVRAKPESVASPYAYDAAEFQWLRGVVHFDEQDGVWNIIYSINPELDDPYAGHLELAHSPHLESLRDGDLVLLEGQVDPSNQDRFGKAMYLVSNVQQLQMP